MFCESCGAQVTGAFCTKCGARASQPSAPSAPPSAYSPPPASPQDAPPPQYAQPLPGAKSGAGLKILFVVLVILGLMGVLAIGGVWFAWHKVKQAAVNHGIDLNRFSETHRGPARQFDACELLTKEDLSQILNLTVERSEGDGLSTHSTCHYFSSGAQQRALEEAAAAKRKLEEETKAGNPKANQSVIVNDVGNMVRGITGAAGPAVGETNGQMLTIEVDSENAKAAMAGFKLGVGLTGAVVMKGADPEGKAMMREEVKGVGDEAISGPLLSLFMFRKGDVSVQLDARLLPGGRDAQIAIAKRIISKL
jgi:hypothetical protein